MPDKATIRQRILERRAALAPQIIERAGRTAADKLAIMEEYKSANTVMAYMDFRNEVPTGPIIDMVRRSGKMLFLPLTDANFNLVPYQIPKDKPLSDCLITSAYGIDEPDPRLCSKADPAVIDLIIVPGSVFDQYENRIGYGKGCYDRFLADLAPKAFKLALAYDFQVLPCIPAGPSDVKMDKILTLGTAAPAPESNS